jgi:single-stranded-DNA-specific exonuclease
MQKILNIDKAAERIKKAVANNEHIILYGDSDLDGISSTTILGEAIKSLGGVVDSAFFPDRERDGYGINVRALEMLKDKAPALFITMDLGIGNIKEVDMANEMGFEVLIIDHHEPLIGLPKASIIVDPKQEIDPYPFKNLANVGIVYNLAIELLGENISPNLKSSFLELAALGTIADMVPQIEQNAEIIEQGLRSLKHTFRPALRAFLNILGDGKVFENSLPKIISALNAAEPVDFQSKGYELLGCSDINECEEIIQKLLDKNKDKQQQIRNVVEEVERRIAKNSEQEIIFEGDPAWKLTFAGVVASIISSKYGKPVFIFKRGDTESCGSVRNPKGTNSVDAMKSCSKYLITYGGHANASGFRLKNENLENFKKELIKYFAK